jgi:heme/copper-type cytochrome/quinol oxidase subunit 3
VIAADQMPAAELPRPRTLLVGTVFAIVACGMFFAGAFGIYLKARNDVVTSAGKWLAPGQISLVPGGMMMVTAAMSVVTMTWAVQAIRNDDRKNAYVALGITLLFGVANINQQVFYYHDMKLKVQGSVAQLLIYVITGAHVAMLIGAMVFVALAAFRALAGQYSSRQSDGIQAASYFWYATMLIYTLIYYGIYVTK